MSCVPPHVLALPRDREEWREAREARQQLLAKVRARRAIALRKRQAMQHTEKTEPS